MIHRIVYITAFQIALYAMGIPMLIAYEMGASHMQRQANPTASIPLQAQKSVVGATVQRDQ
jgi:hypothetical protein